MDKETNQRMIWGAAATLMVKDRRIALLVYASSASVLLFLCLGLLTSLGIFRWLMDISVAVWVAIAIGGMIMNVRTYARQRRAERRNQ